MAPSMSPIQLKSTCNGSDPNLFMLIHRTSEKGKSSSFEFMGLQCDYERTKFNLQKAIMSNLLRINKRKQYL